jgi:integrase
MASMTGLRRKEIVFARWGWMHADGVDVRVEADFVPKGKRGRWVPAVPEARAEALKVATEQNWETQAAAYLLPGNSVSKRMEVFRRLGKWMKDRGWPRRQKAHELRKLFATALCRAADPYAAQMALGHQELETTSRYAQRPAVMAVNPIKLYVLPNPEEADSQVA